MYLIGEKVDDMIIQSYEGMTENYVKLFKVKNHLIESTNITQKELEKVKIIVIGS